jgi:zinc transporter ZupT
LLGWLQSPGLAAPVLATTAGVGGAALGIRLSGLRHNGGIVVPFSAGVLLGVALFGLLPELAAELSWSMSLMLFAAGYGLLLLINRFVYPVCPTCSHDHDHRACATQLHGFAGPLIAAAALHSFLDGWSVATVQSAAPLGIRVGVPLAIALHKVPEGIALGGILRAAMKSRPAAFAGCALAEGVTLLGGVLGLTMAPHLGSQWITYPLGLAAGWLAYLGSHAVHGSWKRVGPRLACVSALTGMAGAAVLQRGAEALFR